MAKKITPAAQTNEPIPATSPAPKRTKKKSPYIIQVLTNWESPANVNHYGDLDAGPFKDTGEAQKHIVDNKVIGVEHPTLPSVRIVAIKWSGSPKIKKIEQFTL
jgi:hypothetical protein